MEIKCKLWSLLVVLSLIQASQAQLKCYVCENCGEMSGNIPLLDCNEDFFNNGGSTEPSTQTTTTDMPTITPDMSTETSSISTNTAEPTTTTTETTTATQNTSTTSTTESTTSPITTTDAETTTTPEETTLPTTGSTMTSNTTLDPASTTTTEQVTTQSTPQVDTTTTTDSVTKVTDTTTKTTEAPSPSPSTEPQPPTPSTANPPSSLPTPPNPGAAGPITDKVVLTVNGTDSERSSSIKPYVASTEFRVRQRRDVAEYTYHCYKVLASVNGSMSTNRGCSRVKTMESVCGQYKEQHPLVQVSKCYPCTSNQCNASTTLNISVAAFFVAIVAVVLQWK